MIPPSHKVPMVCCDIKIIDLPHPKIQIQTLHDAH